MCRVSDRAALCWRYLTCRTSWWKLINPLSTIELDGDGLPREPFETRKATLAFVLPDAGPSASKGHRHSFGRDNLCASSHRYVGSPCRI